MRPYLIDFLIEAHTAFGLLPETLFLTINLLDRYCSRRIVYKKHYQLVGCSALLIAAKYGDRKDRIPTIKELRNMCCGLYEDDMFTQMEWHVLETVDWLVGHPTIDSFLQMALENVAYDPALEHMACYISEIAMFQKEFVSTRPSDMARSSLALARCILNRPQALSSEWASQYESQTLIILSQHLHRPSSILSRKYASHHFSQVSIVLDEFLSRQASISRCYAPPLTPPTKTCSEGFEKLHPPKCTPVTPHKNRFMPVINSGCPTPPETPAGQQYLKAQNARMRPPYPPTPASMKRQSQNQQNGLPFSLPPISQIAPTF